MKITDLLDKPTLEKLLTVHSDLALRMVTVYDRMYQEHGRIMRCTYAYRTFEEQEKLYAQGRTAPGPIVTYSQPGFSWHNFGLAVDSCFRSKTDPYLAQDPDKDKLWSAFGSICRQEGLRWGGDFQIGQQDPPHAQITYNMTMPVARDIYKRVGISGLWTRIDTDYLPKFRIQEKMH